ncbi:unnamed protein product [Aspergillus oryzae]|uniref:Unnamed protein product n=2 Tax=Aspergillus oryzae TaxID=5062 RepID=A0AAN4YMN2_ASPOZ|nr:unnamed protein product [Aspergillus oryzae]GMF92718.1 unnamed protein product [Aspergillus oryzae]GMG08689.1 unnamed protein product [Aspergillus oryzae]GMG33258.1 unnamed protein product [Aspergillus oryzae]GMG49466.1 unnamed protein product [Aspergillus oryzae var. brunneus]
MNIRRSTQSNMNPTETTTILFTALNNLLGSSNCPTLSSTIHQPNPSDKNPQGNMSKAASTAARLQNDFGADLWVKNQTQARVCPSQSIYLHLRIPIWISD